MAAKCRRAMKTDRHRGGRRLVVSRLALTIPSGSMASIVSSLTAHSPGARYRRLSSTAGSEKRPFEADSRTHRVVVDTTSSPGGQPFILLLGFAVARPAERSQQYSGGGRSETLK